MKADEVLRRYAAGEKDFRRINLRGQSFKGKNLSGANFSEADIRGVNFTNAKLTGANFSRAKAGLQQRWVMGLVIVSWIFSALSWVFSTLLGYVVALIFSKDMDDISRVGGWIALIVLAIFCIVTIRKGLLAGLGAVAVTVAVTVAVAGVVAVAGLGAVAGVGAVAVAVAGVGAVAGAFIFAVAGVGAVAVVLLNTYLSWRALQGDERDAWIRSIAIAFAATGGTSFRNANLTDADFTQATLKSTDFRRANLTRTRWHQAKMLDRIRPGTTYLQFPKVQQLLITGQVKDKNFDRQDLRGVNLQGANLADARFIGADLSSANLQDADLSRAKLVQTQLDETDLTGATLTGAYIEDWGITSHTKLDGVRCEYVFMREPTKEDSNPRRKPDNWNETFKDGDFADFIKPIVDTLDLYHNQDVDPRAIAISFKQLAENHPDAELRIVGMEVKGEDKFLLRAKTAKDANYSELNAEYFTIYNRLKALAEQDLKALIAEKDRRILSLETMVATALQRPSFYTQTYQKYGDTMSERKISIDQSGASIGVGYSENVNTEQVGGTIHNYPPEQRQNLADAAAEIQQLLKQLEETYPTATEEEKETALAIRVQQEIKRNPTFKARLRNALKEGGIEALKVLFAPIGIPIEMVRGWIEAEAE